jgi:hypothetical protein
MSSVESKALIDRLLSIQPYHWESLSRYHWINNRSLLVAIGNIRPAKVRAGQLSSAGGSGSCRADSRTHRIVLGSQSSGGHHVAFARSRLHFPLSTPDRSVVNLDCTSGAR